MARFRRLRPKGLLLVAFQISGSISGRPIRLGFRSAAQLLPLDLSTMTSVSV